MPTTFLFYLIDNRTEKPKFTFTDANDKKVLEHIENNIDDYYDDRYNSPQDKFRVLRNSAREKGLAQAIADDSFINARVEVINSITQI
jgi:hypothetical protein